MNGLRDIELSKNWNKHKKGSTVRVDTLRAKWLEKNDFSIPAEVKIKKRSK